MGRIGSINPDYRTHLEYRTTYQSYTIKWSQARSRYQRGNQRHGSHLFFPYFPVGLFFPQIKGCDSVGCLGNIQNTEPQPVPNKTWIWSNNTLIPPNLQVFSNFPYQKKTPSSFLYYSVGCQFFLNNFWNILKGIGHKNTARTPTNWLRHFLHPILTPSWCCQVAGSTRQQWSLRSPGSNGMDWDLLKGGHGFETKKMSPNNRITTKNWPIFVWNMLLHEGISCTISSFKSQNCCSKYNS